VQSAAAPGVETMPAHCAVVAMGLKQPKATRRPSHGLRRRRHLKGAAGGK